MSRAPGCRKWWSQLRTNAVQLQKREMISLGSENYKEYMQNGISIWLPEKQVDWETVWGCFSSTRALGGEAPVLGSKPGLEFTVNLLK